MFYRKLNNSSKQTASCESYTQGVEEKERFTVISRNQISFYLLITKKLEPHLASIIT